MGDSVFGIDKGILKAFALMIIIVGSLTTFFLSEYVSAILLGSVFQTTNDGSIPITDDALTFLGQAEDDFITTFTYVNTGIKFAAALITVVAVILVFSSFLPKRGKKKDGSMDY